MSGKDAAPGNGEGHGNEKPEGGAGLAAVQAGEQVSLHADFRHAVDRLSRRPGTQGRHTAEGGGDVLTGGDVVQSALSLRQGGGNDEPVALAFGGGGLDGSAQLAGGDRYLHSRFSSSFLASFLGSVSPSFFRKMTVIPSPLPFLSSPMAER